MARTIEQIEQSIYDFKAANNILPKFSETVRTSTFGAIIYLVAVAINTFEQVLDIFKIDIENILASQRYGTVPWYAGLVSAFKPGVPYSIVDGALVFADGEGDYEITRVAVVESEASLKIKVAKGGVGEEEPLTSDELAQLSVYLEDAKIVGTSLEIISTEPNVLTISGDVYYNPTYTDTNVDVVLNQTIEEFISNLPFDGLLVETDVRLAILSSLGVLDVDDLVVNLDGSPVDVNEEIPSGYLTFSGTSCTFIPVP